MNETYFIPQPNDGRFHSARSPLTEISKIVQNEVIARGHKVKTTVAPEGYLPVPKILTK